jgi:hypothetical protein
LQYQDYCNKQQNIKRVKSKREFGSILTDEFFCIKIVRKNIIKISTSFRSCPYESLLNFFIQKEWVDEYDDLDTIEVIKEETLQQKEIRILAEQIIKNHSEVSEYYQKDSIEYSKILLNSLNDYLKVCAKLPERDFDKELTNKVEEKIINDEEQEYDEPIDPIEQPKKKMVKRIVKRIVKKKIIKPAEIKLNEVITDEDKIKTTKIRTDQIEDELSDFFKTVKKSNIPNIKSDKSDSESDSESDNDINIDDLETNITWD